MAGTFAEAAGEAYSTVIAPFGGTAAAFTNGNIQPDSADSKTWAKGLFATVSLGAIRFTFDGTTPTTSLGHALTNGDTLRLEGPSNVQNFKAIALAGGVAQLQTTFLRDMK